MYQCFLSIKFTSFQCWNCFECWTNRICSSFREFIVAVEGIIIHTRMYVYSHSMFQQTKLKSFALFEFMHPVPVSIKSSTLNFVAGNTFYINNSTKVYFLLMCVFFFCHKNIFQHKVYIWMLWSDFLNTSSKHNELST